MSSHDLREYSKKILTIHEEERKRISRDLHDETGQLSVSVGSAFNVIEKQIQKGNIAKALETINEAKSILSDTIKRIKMLVLDIRPAELDILGLPSVFRELFSHYTKTYPLKISFKENIGITHINEQVSITLYRVLQEALNNIVKHADARSVRINLLIKSGSIELIIEDDGKGFEYDNYLKDASGMEKLGIRGMKERVDLLNGSFSIQSKPYNRGGTRLTVTFPIEEM